MECDTSDTEGSSRSTDADGEPLRAFRRDFFCFPPPAGGAAGAFASSLANPAAGMIWATSKKPSGFHFRAATEETEGTPEAAGAARDSFTLRPSS